jgi:hypothetical protein
VHRESNVKFMLLANPERRGWTFWQRWQLNVDYRIECGLQAKMSTAGWGRGGEDNAWSIIQDNAEKANAQSRKLQHLFEAGSDSSVIR